PPPANTSLGEFPETTSSSLVVPLFCASQLEPLKCRIVPRPPTTNTPEGELAQMPPHLPEGHGQIGESCSLAHVSVLAAGFAVAVNVRGEPFNPVTVAVTVCAPIIGPSTQVTMASPCASVMVGLDET